MDSPDIQLYPFIRHTHSILRYAILILLLIVVFRSALGHIAKRRYEPFDKKSGLVLLMFTHLQFLLGIALYIISPIAQAARADMAAAMKDDDIRFIAVEHVAIMLFAVVAITVGYSWSKRAKQDNLKYRRSLIGYLIGLVLIIAGIPWERMF